MKPLSITLIGNGNLGGHLYKKLSDEQHDVELVSRNDLENESIYRHADLYVVAVSDSSINPVISILNQLLSNQLIVHTSGATPLVPVDKNRSGVFYPLQSFSKGRTPVWSEIPILIEAENQEDIAVLQDLGKQLGRNAYQLDSNQRGLIHVAAVFTNNFTNHLYRIGEEFLEKEKIDRDLLYPLIRETVDKAQTLGAKAAQTGPAIRGDQKTIRTHQDILSTNTKLRSIYELLTKSIQESN